jgi:hypothetical protein
VGRAGNGTRTRDINLGKVALYQLSYSRLTSSNIKNSRIQRKRDYFKVFLYISGMQAYRYQLLLILLFWTLFSVFPSAGASELVRIESEHAIVHFPSHLERAAEYSIGIFPSIIRDTEHRIHLQVEFTPTILLIHDRRNYPGIFHSDLVVAAAVPEHELIIIDYSRMSGDRHAFRMTLQHELCHLLLHRHIGSRLLPRWLDEGISQWVSEGVSELMTDPGWSALENAALRNDLFRLDDLKEFPGGRRETILAYQQSRSFIEYLVNTYGPSALVALLHEMQRGVEVERAFASAYPHTLREAERDWAGALRARASWLTYISRNMFQFFFLAAALLVVIAFVRKMIERRRHRDPDLHDGDGMQ